MAERGIWRHKFKRLGSQSEDYSAIILDLSEEFSEKHGAINLKGEGLSENKNCSLSDSLSENEWENESEDYSWLSENEWENEWVDMSEINSEHLIVSECLSEDNSENIASAGEFKRREREWFQHACEYRSMSESY